MQSDSKRRLWLRKTLEKGKSFERVWADLVTPCQFFVLLAICVSIVPLQKKYWKQIIYLGDVKIADLRRFYHRESQDILCAVVEPTSHGKVTGKGKKEEWGGIIILYSSFNRERHAATWKLRNWASFKVKHGLLTSKSMDPVAIDEIWTKEPNSLLARIEEIYEQPAISRSYLCPKKQSIANWQQSLARRLQNWV